MTTDLVLRTPDEAFVVAERISRSNLVPAAYRGKSSDLAIALMFGAEVGLPPMASMMRVVVIEGKPGLDAQGMVAVIRGAGHSISGDVTSERAIVKGKRADNGDEMTVTFTFAQAQQIGLTRKQVWKDYPQAMLWARGVSQLARMLFADVLMGLSYTPDELEEIASANGSPRVPTEATEPPPEKPSRPRPPPGKKVEEVTEDGEIVDGEIVPPADEVPVPSEPASDPPSLSQLRAAAANAITEPQMKMLQRLLAKLDVPPDFRRSFVQKELGLAEEISASQLTKQQASKLISKLKIEAGETEADS